MFGFSVVTDLIYLCLESRFEHPAGGYKKIFETVEETGEALPATVTGRPDKKHANDVCI